MPKESISPREGADLGLCSRAKSDMDVGFESSLERWRPCSAVSSGRGEGEVGGGGGWSTMGDSLTPGIDELVRRKIGGFALTTRKSDNKC